MNGRGVEMTEETKATIKREQDQACLSMREQAGAELKMLKEEIKETNSELKAAKPLRLEAER